MDADRVTAQGGKLGRGLAAGQDEATPMAGLPDQLEQASVSLQASPVCADLGARLEYALGVIEHQ